MAIRHIPDGGDFEFSKDFGFSGSAVARHDARNLPNKAVDDEYGDGSYVQSRPMGGAQDVRALRRARGGSVGEPDWSADRAAADRIQPAQPSQRPPIGEKSPGKKMGGRIRRATGGSADDDRPGHDQLGGDFNSNRVVGTVRRATGYKNPGGSGTTTTYGPEQPLYAHDIPIEDFNKESRGGRIKRAMGGPATPAMPPQMPAQNPTQMMPQQPMMARGGRLKKAMGGTVDADYEPKMVSSEVGLNAKPNMNIRAGGNRHAYAQGGAAIPGPAPASMQGNPQQAASASPLSQATITMPAPAMAQASAKMLATGAKLGARQAVGQLANAGQQIAARLRGQGRSAAPEMASPVAQPPPRPEQQGIPAMKKGGHLTAAERHALPKSDFALPGGRYPIPDRNHAANAKARVSQFGTAKEKTEVNAAVSRKYPGMGRKG